MDMIWMEIKIGQGMEVRKIGRDGKTRIDGNGMDIIPDINMNAFIGG